jgi:hypothetical protein
MQKRDENNHGILLSLNALNDNKIPTNSLHSKNTSHLNSLLQAVTALRFMRRRGERDVCPVKD